MYARVPQVYKPSTQFGKADQWPVISRMPLNKEDKEEILFVEAAFILDHLKRAEDAGDPRRHVCLVARSNDLLERYRSFCRDAGVETYLLRANKKDDLTIPGLRLGTMHRVKGLEFDALIIAGVNEGVIPNACLVEDQDNPSAVEENELMERSLLFVAAARAKKEVLVTCHGKPSRFLGPA